MYHICIVILLIVFDHDKNLHFDMCQVKSVDNKYIIAGSGMSKNSMQNVCKVYFAKGP